MSTILLTVVLLINSAVLIILMFKNRKQQDDQLQDICKKFFEESRREMDDNFSRNRVEAMQLSNLQQETLKSAFADFMKFLQEFRDTVRQTDEVQSARIAAALQSYSDRNEQKITAFQEAVKEENRNSRKEQLEFQNRFQENMSSQMKSSRELVDERLKNIQDENRKKLEEMKQTVDEKLQTSMEKHFNDSFKLISERLEQVHKGLGEMQSLASGVGDLKKVLTNVKTRGNFGEIQLSTLLEQYLAPDQYCSNISTVPNSKEIVEFAIKLPGAKDDTPVFLPVDSKFPVEDFQRLTDCYEEFPRLSPEVKKAQENFSRTVKKCASDIKMKYIYPPNTTAFALMFVPSEGIYAEILRIPGLFEKLQSEFNISVVGPSNFVAFLNSLQQGFKTLAIEKRSNEVWQILGAVKSEFNKFGNEMEATRKSLESVVNHMEKIGTRSRALERKLRDVQELSSEESSQLLMSVSE